MKTKQQVVECVYAVLSDKMPHLDLSTFHTDANLRNDLALDSSSVLQLLVHLELEFGLNLPEEAMMNEDFETVRAVAKLLYDAQTRPNSHKVLEYEEDIKLHCFVSCLSEIIKRHGLEQRVLYFAVWDSEVVVTSECQISYHSKNISHQLFVDWFETLYGVKAESWYGHHLHKEENVQRLERLVETRTVDQHIMVMLDMHQLPERVNEFNKDPFPHYLMLGPTSKTEDWFIYDPDYRWEGITQKARILQAMRHPSVSGGYIFSDGEIHAPHPQQIRNYYLESMLLDRNIMTDAVRHVVVQHLSGEDKEGRPLSLENLADALDEVPILSIRKYAYEHGFAFFWRELDLSEGEFEHWCELIAELVKTYKLVLFLAKKLALTGHRAIAEKILQVLNEQDQREFRIKKGLHQAFLRWCDHVFEAQLETIPGIAS